MEYYEFDDKLGAPGYALIVGENYESAVEVYKKYWDINEVSEEYVVKLPYADALMLFIDNVTKNEYPFNLAPITVTEVVEAMDKDGVILIDDED